MNSNESQFLLENAKIYMEAQSSQEFVERFENLFKLYFGINKIDIVNKLKPSDIYNKLCELGAEFIYKYFDKTIASFKNCDGNLNIEVVMSSSTKCYLNDMKGDKELINKIGDMGLYLTCDLDMDTIDNIYNLKI